VTADSVPRQPICRFTISQTPFRLSFHLCVSRCTGVFPVGSFVERGSSEWSHAQGARVVLRGFASLLKDNTQTHLSRSLEKNIATSPWRH
jgi:hypothetical protein